MFKAYDCKEILIKAGYNPKKIACYVLVNWYVDLESCIKKLDLFKVWNIRVADCCFDGGYHIKTKEDWREHQNPKIWPYERLKYFRRKCRKHNQILSGIDPEVK